MPVNIEFTPRTWEEFDTSKSAAFGSSFESGHDTGFSSGGILSDLKAGYQQNFGSSAIISPEDATQRASGLGLSFDKPIREDALTTRMNDRRDDLSRQSIVNRAPAGLGKDAAIIGGSLLGAITDPTQAALAFVPIVGEARFAQLADVIGSKVGARLATGGIEGAVGNAMAAPLTMKIENDRQNDYTMANALRDTAFGGVLGAGLHFTTGYIADRLTGRVGRSIPDKIDAAMPQTRENALRSSVADMMNGREVNVEPILSLDEKYNTPPADPELEHYQFQIEQARNALYSQEGPSKSPLVTWMKEKGGVQVGSALDAELRNMGVNPQSAPGLFKKSGGRTDLDNIVASEFNDKFDTHAVTDGGDFVDRNFILEKLREETFGKKLGSEQEITSWANNFEQELSKRGIDLKSATPEEVRDAMTDAHDIRAAAEQGGHTLNSGDVRAIAATMKENPLYTHEEAIALHLENKGQGGEQAPFDSPQRRPFNEVAKDFAAEKSGLSALAKEMPDTPTAAHKDFIPTDINSVEFALKDAQDRLDEMKGVMQTADQKVLKAMGVDNAGMEEFIKAHDQEIADAREMADAIRAFTNCMLRG